MKKTPQQPSTQVKMMPERPLSLVVTKNIKQQKISNQPLPELVFKKAKFSKINLKSQKLTKIRKPKISWYMKNEKLSTICLSS